MVVHDLDQLAFPTLKASEIAELARRSHASLRQHADGTTLIEVGGQRPFQPQQHLHRVIPGHQPHRMPERPRGLINDL